MDDIAEYRAAVAWLLDNIRGPAESPEPASPGEVAERRRQRFARLRGFLHRLDHPERRFAGVHIAGTSGKGSTAAVVASILRAAGLRTGLHVTPYLQTPLEKLVINGRLMNVRRFVELVERIRRDATAFNGRSADGPLRYGELWVALTFAAFAAEQVEAGVVEVGLGGRWDCTNVFTPRVAVVNRIGMDHVRSLGPDLADIAEHKAGIIKAGVPVVVAPQLEAALRPILEEARQQRAPVLLAGRDFTWQIESRSETGTTFGYRDRDVHWSGLTLPLLGDHQVANAALAVAACRAFDPIRVSADRVGAALRQVRFPGRLERMQRAPEVYLDGAHNAQKAEALAAALRQLGDRRPLVLVIGVLASHQPEGIVDALVPLADRVICTTPRVLGKTALPPEDLAALCRRHGADTEVVPAVGAAVERAIAVGGTGGAVCVTGSLYLVGEARGRWETEEDLLRGAWTAEEDPLPRSLVAPC